MVSPIIKWVGGKTKLLPELVKRMPKRYRMYYEPFFGGGALFFHQQPPNAIISDFNSSLIMMYEAVQMEPERVIRSLAQMSWRHGKRYYKQQRIRWNEPHRVRESDYANMKAYFSALFIYLNRTCFNGLWRVNSKGEFNVPMGDYPIGHTICDAARIRAASKVLQHTRIRRGDYWRNCSEAKDGDLVYFDPPYDPVSSTANFTSYTEDGFGRKEQEQLATRAFDLIHQGAQVMLSNADTPFIRRLYRSFGKGAFTLHKVSAPRAINSNGKKRGKVGELVITGGY